jgi:hypothetical protein
MTGHAAENDAPETPGQQAHRLIREAEVALTDPGKAEYHERLSAAIDAMEGELDFWRQIAAVNRIVDIANERIIPPEGTDDE